jgi:diaminopimelate decarboxylase
METKDNKLYLGGVSAEKLIDEYGSPLYVYEEDKIRENYKKLYSAIKWPKKKLLYACKANTNLAIMRVLREEGAGIDAVSTGEIFLARKAGFNAEDILYTGNNMTDAEMDYAAQEGILLNIGSISRLEKFGKKYPNSDVCIRMNPNIKPDVHPHLATGHLDSKFGIPLIHRDEAKKIAEKYGLNIVGIHSHIGTTIMDIKVFQETLDVILDAALEFEGLDFIDFGGGIGIPYKPEQKEVDIEKLGEYIGKEFGEFCEAYGKELEYRIEPGRYLVAQSGFLLSRINTIKDNSRKKFLGLDTNMAQLVRPSLYGSYHHIINASNMTGKMETVDVVGNICETGDFFAQDREVQEAKEGDVIAIKDVGAYGYSMSSNYNSFPRPAEVMVSGDKAILIRERETFEGFLKGQKT